MPNYIQPDYRIPQTDARVAVQVENVSQPGSALGNPLQLTTRTYYVEPGIDNRMDPNGSIRAGRSGH